MTTNNHAGWYHRASQALHDAGYRRGAARHAVLELLDTQPCAATAIEIEDTLRRHSQTTRPVSRASIYRILAELQTLGLVARLEVGGGIDHFEAVRDGSGHHHHLVCDRCGTLTPFADEALERAIHDVSQRVALNVSEHDVILHGACPDCTPSPAHSTAKQRACCSYGECPVFCVGMSSRKETHVHDNQKRFG